METASGRATSATVFIGHGPSSTAEPTCPACSGGHFEAPSPLPPPAFLNLWPVPCPPQIACPINAFFDDVEDILHDGEDPFNGGEEDELYDVELLICMAIGDNRNGASPASKAAVNSLPVIRNLEELLASDSAQCAVCKDSFELGSSAKQLPCKHLYHAGCILPWLDLRNSCPVYRYEHPTDNDDYDRRAGRATPAAAQDSPLATVAPESGGGEESRNSNRDGIKDGRTDDDMQGDGDGGMKASRFDLD